MVDVGFGQLATSTGYARSKVLKDAMSDAHPVYDYMKSNGGIRRIPGGREVVEEALTAQNTTVDWVGESGTTSVADVQIVDAAVFPWRYMLGSAVWTLAERYKNSGGNDVQYIDIIGAKYTALENTSLNKFCEGMLSAGTGSGGLQLPGLAALVSTTPSTGTVGTIDRSSANAAWFRNQAFNTASDWTLGAVDSSNVKQFLDKGINATMRNSKSMIDMGLLGQTHFEALTAAVGAHQMIVNQNDTARVGFDKIFYRGIPMFLGNGINYSGFTAQTVTRTYLLCVKPGGVNLVFHNKAEFDLLEPVNATDMAAVTRLMFTMATMTIGGLAKMNWVGFD